MNCVTVTNVYFYELCVGYEWVLCCGVASLGFGVVDVYWLVLLGAMYCNRPLS